MSAVARARSAAPVIAELLRAPAAFGAVGDAVAGAYAAAGTPKRHLLMPIASVMLYAGGMGLNDWADQDQDARDRPERPIPSGRIPSGTALALSAGLIAGGVAVAGLVGGTRGTARAGALAATVVAYDTLAKDTPAGSWVMAACRSLNVVLGAGSLRAALVPALTVGAHTVAVTELSRAEVSGTDATLPENVRIAVLGVAASAVAGGRTRGGRGRLALGRLGAAAGAARYLTKTLPPLATAVQRPNATNVRDAVRASLGAVIPLQAALIARTGQLAPAAAVASLEIVQSHLVRRLQGDTT